MSESTSSSWLDSPNYGEYTVHPTANAFPLMDPKTYEEVKQDIIANGLQVPLKLRAGTKEILDGRNRFLICREVGIDPTFEEFDGTEVDIIKHILSLNAKRRHLSPGDLGFATADIAQQLIAAQKAEAAQRVREAGARGRAAMVAKAQGGAGGAVPEPLTTLPQRKTAPRARDIVAAALGVSTDTIRRVQAIKAHPDLEADVRAHKKTLNAAYQEVRARRAAPVPANNIVVPLRKPERIGHLPPMPTIDQINRKQTYDMWMAGVLNQWRGKERNILDEWRVERIPAFITTLEIFLAVWDSVPQEWRDIAMHTDRSTTS